MANIYVRSTDGSDADSGADWANAKATLAGAAAIDAAGDTVFLSQAHSESTAAGVGFTFAGTPANPVRVICGDDAADPPTTEATSALVATTGASLINFAGSAYLRGIQFSCGTGATTASMTLCVTAGTAESQVFEACALRLGTTATTSRIVVGSSTGTTQKSCVLHNTAVKFGNASQSIQVSGVERFIWTGGSVESGSATPTAGLILFGNNGRGGPAEVSGVDFSNLTTSLKMFNGGSVFASRGVLRNCKLPSGIAGPGWLSTTVTAKGARYEAYNCASDDTTHRFVISEYAGTVNDETTVVMSGGASDGVTTYSMKMVSTANANRTIAVLRSPEVSIINDAVGSAITVECEVVTDGVTLTDAECWLEIQQPGTSGFPLSTFHTDAASMLAAGTAQATSTATWTTTGLASPTKQKLSVTFTPRERGEITAVVGLAKPSTTVYANPPAKV